MFWQFLVVGYGSGQKQKRLRHLPVYSFEREIQEELGIGPSTVRYYFTQLSAYKESGRLIDSTFVSRKTKTSTSRLM